MKDVTVYRCLYVVHPFILVMISNLNLLKKCLQYDGVLELLKKKIKNNNSFILVKQILDDIEQWFK